jgi:uncharacterized protein with HEPN domain
LEGDANDSLVEALDFCTELAYFTGGRGTERDDIERMRYLAIERLLLLIGEAMARAIRAEPALATEIPTNNRIRGMRNRLAHEYDAIKFDIVWDAAETHVPILINDIEGILRARGELEPSTPEPAAE